MLTLRGAPDLGAALAAKVGLLGCVAKDFDLAFVGEARGNAERLHRELRHLEREFVLHRLVCDDWVVGVLFLLARRDVVADASSVAFEAVASRRVGVVVVRCLGRGALHCIGGCTTSARAPPSRAELPRQ